MNVTEATGPGVGDWLTDRLRAWGVEFLTDVQARALQAGVADGRSMIVGAPTSSGKTLVGEIAVLSILKDGGRAIYLVSHKALAEQKHRDFLARFGELSPQPIASVGLNTGDRAEGNIDARLMVATYEKALGLILTGQLNPSSALIVADEFQIVGDPGRGPEIESLCAILRQRGIRQFVGLTATVENPDDLAGWMGCQLVSSSHRDVPLHQEIWYGGRVFRTTFGQSEGQEIKASMPARGDVAEVVGQLIRDGRGPVLVFTESRREAAGYASSFGQTRPRVGDGIALAEQLDLYSEPTESSEQLRENAEKRVAFHTADLSPQERQVLETGFAESKFDVCFATSTLAAGVNFPFRSVVIPKLTYQWGDRAGSRLPRSEYRNMSGRAGRLGMHEDGHAILLPRDRVELTHANSLVLPDNDRLASQLIKLSLRKSVLMLVASRVASSSEGIASFFRSTLYWYQTLDRNPALVERLEGDTRAASEWLIKNGLIRDEEGTLLVTPLGQGAALSGLLPATAVKFAGMLSKHGAELAMSFEQWIPALIHAVCASDEFRSDRPSRFFPYVQTAYGSVAYWGSKQLLLPLDRADLQLAQCAHAVVLFIEGLAERKIHYATQVPSGAIHRLAVDVAWVLDGLHKIACVRDLGCPQGVSNQVAMLARRVRWGAPAEALDVIRVAERHGVPGFGRQRAMSLISQGIATLGDVLTTAKDKPIQLLRSDRRAQALVEAASSAVGLGPDRLAATHGRVAKELGIEKLVEACNLEQGVEYEKAVAELLRVETSWMVTVLDDGKRQNVPDILVKLGDLEMLIECKTCTKSPPLIKKEDAWAVIQKASDFAKSMRRVTLGKPTFDETSKKKAAASEDLTLVEHSIFLEGLLRVHAGTLQPADFLKWLGAPGVAEIERLGGTPTFAA